MLLPVAEASHPVAEASHPVAEASHPNNPDNQVSRAHNDEQTQNAYEPIKKPPEMDPPTASKPCAP